MPFGLWCAAINASMGKSAKADVTKNKNDKKKKLKGAGTNEVPGHPDDGSTASVLVASVLVATLILCLSALRKVKDIVSVLRGLDGHFLMGPGKLYPGWLLPFAFLHEVTTVVLLWVDRSIGVLMSFAFVGGILHAQFSPGGPFELSGPIALVPVWILLAATIGCVTNETGPVAKAIRLRRLSLTAFRLVCAELLALGVFSGVLLSRLQT